jgi:hypothetical protein
MKKMTAIAGALLVAFAQPALAADHCLFIGRDDINGVRYVCHGKDHIRYLVEGTFLHGKGYWLESRTINKTSEPFFTVLAGKRDGTLDPYKTWAECDATIHEHLTCDGLVCAAAQCSFHNIPVLSDYPEDEGEKWEDED